QTGMRAYLGAAIRRAGQSLGVLEVMREPERPFGYGDEQLLRTLADIVAVAVSHARQAASLQAAQHRLAMLAEASAVLTTSFEYQSTLRHVAALAVPTLADWCTISIVAENRAIRQVASTHTDAIHADLSEQLRAYVPRPERQSALAHVLRTGTSALYRNLSEVEPLPAAHDSEHARLLGAL